MLAAAAAGRPGGAGVPRHSPTQRAQGYCTPHPGPGEHVKGLVDPRDSGWQPEPLCAFTLEARPEAGGCLGPNAPPSVQSPDFEPY